MVTVTPSAYHVDHSPILRDGEAYVFPTGTVYLDACCAVVAERWAEAPARLLVTKIADVGQRARCGKCDEPLGV